MQLVERDTATAPKSFTLSKESLLPEMSDGLQDGRRMKKTEMLATRRSLVDRLANWEDRKHWQEFFDTYWKLI
jgi:hypothetical protein